MADIEKYREKYLESEEEVQDILDFCIRCASFVQGHASVTAYLSGRMSRAMCV